MSYPKIGSRLNAAKYEKLLTAAALHAAKMEAGDSILFDKLHLHPLAQNAYDILVAQMRQCPLEMLRVFDVMAEGRYEYDDHLLMPEGVEPPFDTSMEESGRFLAECLYKTSDLAKTPNLPQMLRVKPEERTLLLLGIVTELYDENGVRGKKVGFRERRAVEKEAKNDFDTHMTKRYLKEQRDYRSDLFKRAKAFGFERRSPMLTEIKRINRLADKTSAGLVKNGRRLAVYEARMAAGHELSKRETKGMLTCLQSMHRLQSDYCAAMQARGADLRNYLTNFGDGLEHSFHQFCNELIRHTELRDPIAAYSASQTRGDALLGIENTYDLRNPIRLDTPETSRFRAAQDKAYEKLDRQPKAVAVEEDIIESDDDLTLFGSEPTDSELSDDITPPPPAVVLGGSRRQISVDLTGGRGNEKQAPIDEKEWSSISSPEPERSDDITKTESELSDLI